MTEDLTKETETPPEEKNAPREATEASAKPTPLDPSMEMLFAKAVEGQERIAKKLDPDDDGLEVEIEESEPERAYDGPRGTDPREIHQRMQTLVKKQTEEILDLEAKLEESEGKVEALRDRLMRMQADSENYRKRMTREREDQVKFGNEKFIREMLPVVDHFELALESTQETDAAKLAEGVTMIYQQMIEHLKKYGVEAVDTVGQPFDPSYHEAFQQFPTDAVPPNHVVQQFQKGYLMFGRLLRPARVAVALAPQGDQSQPENPEAKAEEAKPKDEASAESETGS